MQKIWHYNGEAVSYTFTSGGVKNINVHVRRDGSLYVSAPRLCPQQRIEAFLSTHADKLLPAMRARQQAIAVGTAPLQTGATVPLLGERRTLRLLPGRRRAVWDTSTELCLTHRPADGEGARRAVLARYLSDLAKTEINLICRKIYDEFFSGLFSYPTVRFRRMVARWGSCYKAKGIITFNTRLILADRGAIEYVVMHELVHMLHPDHSARFYTALAARMPDYKRRRAALRAVDLTRENWI